MIIKLIFLIFFFLSSLFLHCQKADHLPDLKKIDFYLQTSLETWEVPGMAVAIVINDSIIFQKGFGVATINTTDSVDENTIFAIASNTKAFTTASLAILVQNELLNWDDKVISYLPEFKMYNDYVTNEITIRDFLCHRSGLKTFSGDLIWYGSNYSREEVVQRIQYLEPEYPFRTEFGYSNLMYLVAGEILETISQKTWEENISENFLIPLNMDRTITSVTQFKHYTNIATPHNKKNGEIIPIKQINWDNIAPAGALNSSVYDMAKWIKFQLNGRFIDGEKLYNDSINNELWTIQTNQKIYEVEKMLWPTISDKGYGLGWKLFNYHNYKIVSHSGGIDGMISQVVLIPEKKFGFVILTNSSMNFPLPIMYFIMDEYLNVKHIDYADYFKQYYEIGEEAQQLYFTKLEAEQDTVYSAPLPAIEYTGTYFCDVYGEATVNLVNDNLWLQFEETPIYKGKIDYYNTNKFWIEMINVPSLPKGIVEFNLIDNYIYMLIDIPNPDFDFTELKFRKQLNNQ